MNTPSLHIAIFSYNRGDYLKNCIDSLQRNMPGYSWAVYDDGSDEPDTVSYLKTLGDSVHHMKSASDDRHGGYYNNMQAALAGCTSDYLLMLQDDLQVVRPFAQKELLGVDQIFKNSLDIGFLSPVFLKGSKRDYFQKRYQPDPRLRCYRWLADPLEVGKVPRKYADVSLLHVARLREKGWQFAASEEENGALADSFFGDMVQAAEPWIFYIPEEPAYRGRVLTFGAKLAAKMSGNQVKAFVDMSQQASEAFAHRALSIYPFAEDFVDTVDPSVRKPYKFNVYRTRWLPLVLNKLELWWRQFRAS